MEPLPFSVVHQSRTASGPKPPSWLKVRMTQGENYLELKERMRSQTLHTVCEEALCPNIYECWEARTATFLILGDICTRNCGFCAITTGRPVGLDREEPCRARVATEGSGARAVASRRADRQADPQRG